MLSVWKDLTVCDFLDIIDLWKLVGLGKMGFKAQTCWTDLLAFWGVWNRSRILNFGPDWLFFRFSRALVYSAFSRCTDSAGTLTWWPWPIFYTSQTLTHFMLMFSISSNIRPTTIKPCIVLHLIALAWWVPWPGDLDLYLTHFMLMFDNSSTIRSTTTIPCIVLLLDVLN